jgi:diguanylate cyclase (GGDEF)-like protein
MDKKAQLQACVEDQNSLQQVRLATRIYILRMLSVFGVGTVFVFGINSLWIGKSWLGGFLIVVAIMSALSMFWLMKNNNQKVASAIIAFGAVLLSLVLFSTGGVQNTGPLWIYPLVAVAIFLTEFIVGIITVSLLILYCGVVAYLQPSFFEASYSPDIITRFLFSLTMMCFFCLCIEYAGERSHSTIQSLHSALSDAANTDTLTKLYNRRFIHDNFIKNDNFSGVFEHNGTVLLLDIDHFKLFNDEHGHDVGDSVLKLVGETLTSTTRNDDIVARWGGEEFLVILTHSTPEIATKRANQFREAIAAQSLFTDAGKLTITVSIGVSHISASKKASAILKHADNKLYEAKAAGRNRVC